MRHSSSIMLIAAITPPPKNNPKNSRPKLRSKYCLVMYNNTINVAIITTHWSVGTGSLLGTSLPGLSNICNLENISRHIHMDIAHTPIYVINNHTFIYTDNTIV